VVGSSFTLNALGMTLILGMLDLINFAHGEFFSLGAFIALTLAVVLKLPYLLSVALAIVVVGFIGMASERLAFRPLRSAPRLSLLISSLGLSIFLQNLAQLIWGPDPRDFSSPFLKLSVEFFGFSVNGQRVLIFGLALGLIGLLYVLIQRTDVGIAMRACAYDLQTASLLGVRTDLVVMLTFMVGAALAAAAGALLGPVFTVYPTMGLAAKMKAFVVVVMGGIGNISGAIWSGFILGMVETLAAGFISSQYKDAIAFIVLILVLVFKPTGLFVRSSVEKV
jgi:branched-chain amino acid transport system permease protein